MTLLLRPGDALPLAEPAALPRPAAAVSSVNPLVRAAFYLFVASIPFELPRSALPLEVPTLTGLLLLLFSAFDLRACYRRLPAALICFLVWFAILAVRAAAPTEHSAETLRFLANAAQLLLLFWIAVNVLGDEVTVRGTLWALVAATTARALVQVTGVAATTITVWTGGARITAFGQNPNLSAIIMSAGFAALVGLVVLRKPHLPRPGLLALPAVPLLAFAVIQTGSRGGLLCLAAGLLALLLSGRTLLARLRAAVIGLALLAGVAYLAIRSETMHNRVVVSSEIHYLAGRERIYPAALDMIREKPLLGWGPIANQYEIADRIRERHRVKRDAHNIVLELLSSVGIIGAVPFLMGLVLCLDGAVRARHGALGVLPLAVLAAVLMGTMSGTWLGSKVLWLVLGLALAAGQWWRPTTVEERWARCAA